MYEAQKMVREFHKEFDIHVAERPGVPDPKTTVLRARLIQEEFDELKEALKAENLPAIAKELADLLYVVYGTAVSYGIDMAPVFREVQRSNMSKVGGYKRTTASGSSHPLIHRPGLSLFWKASGGGHPRAGREIVHHEKCDPCPASGMVAALVRQ